MIWLVEALFHLAGITGGLLEGLTTLFGCWREAELSLMYQGKQGVILRIKGGIIYLVIVNDVICHYLSFIFISIDFA